MGRECSIRESPHSWQILILTFVPLAWIFQNCSSAFQPHLPNRPTPPEWPSVPGSHLHSCALPDVSQPGNSSMSGQHFDAFKKFSENISFTLFLLFEVKWEDRSKLSSLSLSGEDIQHFYWNYTKCIGYFVRISWVYYAGSSSMNMRSVSI